MSSRSASPAWRASTPSSSDDTILQLHPGRLFLMSTGCRSQTKFMPAVGRELLGLHAVTFLTELRPEMHATLSSKQASFLPCDALRCTVFVIVILSVCLSVRPSVTLVDCVHVVRPTIMIPSPYGSPIILVSGDITIIPKFEGGYPERGR